MSVNPNAPAPSGADASSGSSPNTVSAAELAALGLIDPADADREPGSTTPSTANQQTETTPTPTPATTPTQQTVDPAVWESDANPYKRAASQPAQETPEAFLSRRTNEITLQVQAAHAQLLPEVQAGRLAPEMANAFVQLAQGQAMAQAQLEAERIRLLPAAKLTAAQRIATEFSTGNVKITPDELADAPTIEAMRERAQERAATRRNTAFTTRKTTKADGAEAGAGTGTVDARTIDSLSPYDKIKLGLLRGHSR